MEPTRQEGHFMGEVSSLLLYKKARWFETVPPFTLSGIIDDIKDNEDKETPIKSRNSRKKVDNTCNNTPSKSYTLQ